MITRRTFLVRTAQTSLAAFATGSLNNIAIQKGQASPLSKQQLRIPSELSGSELTLAQGKYQLFSGEDTNMLLINGTFPAPTIRIKKGETFNKKITNGLQESSILHWHGVHAPSNMSGHPINAVEGGNSYSVNFPIIQRASTNFYHAHPDMNTGKQVYMGLVGCFIIEDDEEKALNLPSGNFDVPLVITDKRFDASHQLIYNLTDVDMLSGWLGDTILVNGTPDPYLEVSQTLYRFRLINASNARFYKIALSDGRKFTVIGNDGGFVETPLELTEAWLAPAERLDILIDFSSYTLGQSLNLKTLKFNFSDRDGSGTMPQGTETDILEFKVTTGNTSGGVVPTQLPVIEKYKEADALYSREWVVAALHHMNEQHYDINRIDAHVPFGNLELWTFQSEAINTHPMHVHGAQFQVLRRNGIPPEPTESGWKDVVRLDPQGKVEVLIKFHEYTGLYLVHCHKLEHADAGMMANYQIDAAGSVNSKNESLFSISPNPARDYALMVFPALEEQTDLHVMDMKGNLLIEEKISEGTDRYGIVTSKLAEGNYLIRLGTTTAQLIVLR